MDEPAPQLPLRKLIAIWRDAIQEETAAAGAQAQASHILDEATRYRCKLAAELYGRLKNLGGNVSVEVDGAVAVMAEGGVVRLLRLFRPEADYVDAPDEF